MLFLAMTTGVEGSPIRYPKQLECLLCEVTAIKED